MKGPILIGGDGRSGTTLLQGILDSHSDLSVGPELHFMGPHNLTEYVLDCLELISKNDPRISEQGVREFPEFKPGLRFLNRLKRFGLTPPEVRNLVVHFLERGNLGVTFTDRLEIVQEISVRRAKKFGKTIHGFKIMKMISKASQLLENWADAKFVHIVRDGRDVAASQLLDHPGWGYTSIEAAARGWSKVARQALADHNEGIVLAIRYEDLVSNPDETLFKVSGFLELPFVQGLASWDRTQLANFLGHHPSAKRLAEPIDSISVGRWRQDLTAHQINIFQEYAAEELQVWRYT